MFHANWIIQSRFFIIDWISNDSRSALFVDSTSDVSNIRYSRYIIRTKTTEPPLGTIKTFQMYRNTRAQVWFSSRSLFIMHTSYTNGIVRPRKMSHFTFYRTCASSTINEPADVFFFPTPRGNSGDLLHLLRAQVSQVSQYGLYCFRVNAKKSARNTSTDHRLVEVQKWKKRKNRKKPVM